MELTKNSGRDISTIRVLSDIMPRLLGLSDCDYRRCMSTVHICRSVIIIPSDLPTSQFMLRSTSKLQGVFLFRDILDRMGVRFFMARALWTQILIYKKMLVHTVLNEDWLSFLRTFRFGVGRIGAKKEFHII